MTSKQVDLDKYALDKYLDAIQKLHAPITKGDLRQRVLKRMHSRKQLACPQYMKDELDTRDSELLDYDESRQIPLCNTKCSYTFGKVNQSQTENVNVRMAFTISVDDRSYLIPIKLDIPANSVVTSTLQTYIDESMSSLLYKTDNIVVNPIIPTQPQDTYDYLCQGTARRRKLQEVEIKEYKECLEGEVKYWQRIQSEQWLDSFLEEPNINDLFPGLLD